MIWHALLSAGIVASLCGVAWNLAAIVRLGLDMSFARVGDEPWLWPNPGSLTVWTGEEWFTVTVMRVGFGRWGIAVCRDVVPRRANPIELIGRERAEDHARERADELARRALAGRAGRPVMQPAGRRRG